MKQTSGSLLKAIILPAVIFQLFSVPAIADYPKNEAQSLFDMPLEELMQVKVISSTRREESG